MKIAMIGHKDFPSRSGGVEVVVYELATRLTAKGHSVSVFNRGKEPGHNHYTAEGVECFRCTAPKKKSLNAFVYSITATFCALGKGFDIFHYHAIGPSALLVLPHIMGKKTVATVHGLNWQIGRWNRFAAWYLQLGEKVIAKYADEVIVLSESAKEYFREKYGRETTFIRNAVTPVEPCSPELIREKWNLEKNGYILFLARISQEKGVHYLMEAYNKISTDKKLVIAGEVPEGEYGDRIRELAASNPNIILAGFVSGQIMNELYSNTALYVLPSETEGLALSLLEGLSAGVPCLTSDIPENTVVTGHFGRSFESKNTDSLAEALTDCLDNPPPAELLGEQRKHIIAAYGYDKVVDATLELYRRLTDTNK